ncbi:MAG: hypothetical protein AAF125_05640 [Chloroflexota bacterium]
MPTFASPKKAPAPKSGGSTSTSGAKKAPAKAPNLTDFVNAPTVDNLTPETAAYLQRTIGNHALQRLIQREPGDNDNDNSGSKDSDKGTGGARVTSTLKDVLELSYKVNHFPPKMIEYIEKKVANRKGKKKDANLLLDLIAIHDKILAKAKAGDAKSLDALIKKLGSSADDTLIENTRLALKSVFFDLDDYGGNIQYVLDSFREKGAKRNMKRMEETLDQNASKKDTGISTSSKIASTGAGVGIGVVASVPLTPIGGAIVGYLSKKLIDFGIKKSASKAKDKAYVKKQKTMNDMDQFEPLVNSYGKKKGKMENAVDYVKDSVKAYTKKENTAREVGKQVIKKSATLGLEVTKEAIDFATQGVASVVTDTATSLVQEKILDKALGKTEVEHDGVKYEMDYNALEKFDTFIDGVLKDIQSL